MQIFIGIFLAIFPLYIFLIMLVYEWFSKDK